MEKCVSFDAHITALRLFYAHGKCGSWFFVHEVLHKNDKKWRQNTIFFWQFGSTSYWTTNFLPIHKRKIPEKRFTVYVDNEVPEIIGAVCCPTCWNKSEECACISTTKSSPLYHCKKCKACCHIPNIPFREGNQQNFCLVDMVHLALPNRQIETTKQKNSFTAKASRPITIN